MTRREFITLIGGAAAAWPLAARAQQATRLPRIGWLVTGSPASYRFSLAAFRDGLKTLNYIEGQNISIEYRWAEGKIERLPELAQSLVRERVDIILAGGSLGAEAAKHATSVIPIVTAGAGDLVDLGLVESLARPGGNLTGFVAVAPEAAAKRFQIIKEMRPRTIGAQRSYGIPPVPMPSLSGRLRRNSQQQMISPSSFMVLVTSMNCGTGWLVLRNPLLTFLSF